MELILDFMFRIGLLIFMYITILMNRTLRKQLEYLGDLTELQQKQIDYLIKNKYKRNILTNK